MLSTNYGDLVPEDEMLTHQIVDTFATVGQSDPSWTEKIWTMAHARDNSLQIVLGVGKYTNRGVFDGAAGVCRGTEQWTVRAGRRLSSDPASTDVGPIHYERRRAVEGDSRPPRRRTSTRRSRSTWCCGANSLPALEDPWPDRSPDGYRVTHNVLRYHQIGVASGWVEVEGERTEIAPDEWISIRDHSWGLRPGRRQADPRPAPRRQAPDQPDVHDVAPDDTDAPGRLELLAVRLLAGGAGPRLQPNPLSGRATERRRHLAPVRLRRAGTELRGRQPALHPRHRHADRQPTGQASDHRHGGGPDRLSPRHRPATTAGTTGCTANGSATCEVEGSHITDCDKPETARQASSVA